MSQLYSIVYTDVGVCQARVQWCVCSGVVCVIDDISVLQ